MQPVDLIQRLRLAESNLLTSLLGGTQVLASYYQMWSTLPHEIFIASQNGNIGHETLSLAHLVATRISKIAACFLDIKHDEELSTSQLQSDCDAMFHQMTSLNISAQPKSSCPDHAHPLRSSNATTSNPEYSSLPASACQWLVDNLHNPYPTAEVKARMAATSHCQVSSINSWFINARRRIGWTTLCREHFSNRRADMLDAAYRALVAEDPQRTLSPELRHSFITMKVAAEGLHSSTFTRSVFAGCLEKIAKDVTEEDKKSVGIDQVNEAKLSKAAQDSYPSPDPSITSSPVSASDNSFAEDEGDVTPPIVTGSKRRRSSMDLADRPSSPSSRPIKRLRPSTMSRTCLPSSPVSTDGVNESSDHSFSNLSSTHSVPPAPEEESPSRKELSGTNAIDYSIDGWFKSNFDDLFAIPPPVDAIEPDFSASWEVELFKDYSIPGIPKHTPKRPPTSTGTQMFASTELADLNNLLQTINHDPFVTPSCCMPTSNGAGTPYATFPDLSIPDISQTNVDWTSLLKGTEFYQPTVYSPIDSRPLPEIDLPMLQLPQAILAANPQGDLASRQAKLHQFHAMQEAVWKMEQELRSEGVVI